MTESALWLGASGHEYKYFVHDLDFEPDENQDGNYVFAESTVDGWRAVYVGQGDLKDRKAAALNEGCVTRKGATHFHCHLNGSQPDRLKEEGDVLNGNPEAFEPNGCNSPR